MAMVSVELSDGTIHEYAGGITAGEVIFNVHGKKSGAVGVLID